VTRTAKALASWLGAAWHTTLDLRPDLDQIEALTAEREALWARIEKVSFLTLNEKRAAVGYAPLEDPPPSATDVERSSVGRKYRSDQARAPAGTSDGGQWVDEGGGSGGGASNSTRTLSDANSDDADFWKPGAQIAQAGGNYGIDVTEEDRLYGGHTYKRHIGKSDEYLKARIVGSRVNIPAVGEGGRKRAGSFASIEAANKLVNATLSDPENVKKIEAFVRRDFFYMLPVLYVRKSFSSVTGREAYGPKGRGPDMRQTYSVELKLLRSNKSPRGFYIRSAYPFNPD